jgi:hypothetical protein
MNPNDEITALALDYINSKEAISERVREAFADMPRAPLAQLVDEFLAMQSMIDLAPVLKRIREVNQGRLEDLNLPVFQSYLIARCETDELQLRRAISALNNFLVIKAASSRGDKTVLIAARDDDSTGRKSASTDDLLQQVKKRVR